MKVDAGMAQEEHDKWAERAKGCLHVLDLQRFAWAIVALILLALGSSTPANANVSFTRAWGWGVIDGMSKFEICTSSCQSGIAGGGAGAFFGAAGDATDPSGDVYVADDGNDRIDEFSAAGAFIKAYGWGVSDGMGKFETCTSSCQSGIGGSGAGQLLSPWGVASDPSGTVYVTDLSDERIDEFSAAGAFIKAYGWGVSDGMSKFETCTSSCQSGIGGSGAGQLDNPRGVASDPSGDVYVADLYNDRIDEFSAAGAFIKAYGWGVSDGMGKFETCTSSCQSGIGGSGAGQLDYPEDVATDRSGGVYVADYFNHRIDEFSAAGAFIKAYGWGVSDGASSFETCTSTCQAGIGGSGAGQLDYPDYVATDPGGNVYVSDNDNRIDEFSAAGAFIKAWGWGVTDGMSKFETCTSSCQAGIGGGGAGQLYTPEGVATNSLGDVYEVSSVNSRIDEFANPSSVKYTLTVSLAGPGAGTVSSNPAGIACPSSCAHSYGSPTSVTLMATPAAGSTFAGWSGACSGTGTCNVTMSAARGVTANFTLRPRKIITKAKLDQKHHRAKFSFNAIGAAVGFQCALVKKPKEHQHKQPKPHFTRCRSPKTYKHLKRGTYTFEVRSFDAAGVDSTPAKKSFTIH